MRDMVIQRSSLSRKDPQLVAKLFELSTPELEDGTIEIVKIVREPGFKTKSSLLQNLKK